MDGQSQWPIWQELIRTAAMGAAAYLGYILALRKDRSIRQDELDRAGRYAAIRIVCELDKFVAECCDVAHDMGEPDQEGCMMPAVENPKLSLPEVEWKSVNADLMYRALALPNEIHYAEETIDATMKYLAGPPDYDEYYEERMFQYGNLGLKALSLADDFRRAYLVPMREGQGFKPKELLAPKVASLAKKRKEQQNMQMEKSHDP
jgi:hypothetical protein